MDEFVNYLQKLTGGNPGAFNACVNISLDNEPSHALTILKLLETLELTGPQIYELWADECRCEVREFTREIIIRASQKLMPDSKPVPSA